MCVITWSQYTIDALLIVFIYFLAAIVYLFWVKKKLSKQAADGGDGNARGEVRLYALDGTTVGSVPAAETSEEMSRNHRIQGQVHDMVDELQSYIVQAGEEEIGKPDLLTSLKIIILKYSDIKESMFREGIRNLIATTVEDYCVYRLSADELAGLWIDDQA